MPISWTAEQELVIKAQKDARLLVSAGPGTGKTAVACARIAYLINHLGVPPVHVWLVSFTRTAVHELRSRISEYLTDKSQVYGIRIATIDSHAWAIHSGFSDDAQLSGSYEDNINNVIKLVQSNDGVFEYLSNVQHLFVDEAQDVVGARKDLMLEIIHALPSTAGVTILADESQSIYGFSEETNELSDGMTLPEAIREYREDFGSFSESELLEIHRTSDFTLKRIFSEGRQIVAKKNKCAESLNKIREFVSEINHGSVGQFRNDIENLRDPASDMFFLFRKRGEALEASSYFSAIPHRLRMSGLPNVMDLWISKMFWDWDNNRINEDSFFKRWEERISSVQCCAEDAWSTLVRYFGISQNQISIEKLVSRLAGGAPPREFCHPDFGSDGPVVGTIHGVKGREADKVRFYLPCSFSNMDEEVDKVSEEARVFFVAATRARKELKIGWGVKRTFPKHVAKGGRAFTSRNYKKNGAASVEIGRDGDFDAEGLAGKSLFENREHVEWAQDEIASLEGKITLGCSAFLGTPEDDYRYRLEIEEGLDPICYLSTNVNQDMFKIAKELESSKPPWKINHMRIFGARSLVLPPDSAVREKLFSPWRDTGFLLVPLVLSYSTVYFRN